MNYQRGDIVLADLPYSDRSGGKKRPALVVQCDRNNRLIDIATPAGAESGLLHTSAVKCEHIITLHRRFVERVLGRVPPNLMPKVDGCLKASLGLP